MLLSPERPHQSKFPLINAQRVTRATRLSERKRLHFGTLERAIAEWEKRVKVSDNGNYRVFWE